MASSSSAPAAVTTTGSVYDYLSYDYSVGYSANGTLTIDAGSSFTRTQSDLGCRPGLTGTVTVTGTGSTWTNTRLNVGLTGSGVLNVQAGGLANTSVGFVGFESGSTGTATVTGAGSTWNNTSALWVSYNGTGALTVSDGGLVTAATLYASPADLHGNGTISATGAVLDSDLQFDATHGTTQNFAFGAGGTLSLNANGTGDLGAGYKGTGSLRFADGVTVASNAGYLGYLPGSSGAATVAGPASKWMHSGTLYVGNLGAGTLTVQDGAQVGNTSLVAAGGAAVGYEPGSTGTATVTGAGSKWTENFTLTVGDRGAGTLNIQSGGQVSNGGDGRIGFEPGSNGTVTVDGIGSSWTVTSSFRVGADGSGTLNVRNGGRVTSGGEAAVGLDTGSTGIVTVDGAGSTWTVNNSLRVYHGTLNIQNGGRVTNTSADVAGTVTVTGAGSKWTNTSSVSQAGTLNIQDGGQVSNADFSLGYQSAGTATVTGAGSKWNNSGDLLVGFVGTGKLTVSDGALVTARTLYGAPANLYGNGTISTHGAVLDANLTLDDATRGADQTTPFGTGGTLNLTLDGTGALGAGYKQTGTLRIAGGVAVASAAGYLGYRPGSAGTATVTGTGSKWSNTGDLDVGTSGTGTLDIQAGASVTDTHGYLGYNTNSTGTATVTGPGSTWANTSFVNLGNGGGRGTLTVSDHARVTASSLSVSSSQSVLRLHVSGNGMVLLGTATTAGSVTNRGSVNLYADPLLAPGTYTPVADYAGRTMTWSGTGSYNAVGGTWDTSAKTFTVPAAKTLPAGQTDDVTTAQRLLITDPATGHQVGLSFGPITGSPTLSATPTTPAEQASLTSLPAVTGSLLSGWDFTTTLPTQETLLSFDLGPGAQDLRLWHLSGGTWTPYAPAWQTYDSAGVLTFPVNTFSGYAVTGTVPEPAALSMMAAACMTLPRRRRRHEPPPPPRRCPKPRPML